MEYLTEEKYTHLDTVNTIEDWNIRDVKVCVCVHVFMLGVCNLLHWLTHPIQASASTPISYWYYSTTLNVHPDW